MLLRCWQKEEAGTQLLQFIQWGFMMDFSGWNLSEFFCTDTYYPGCFPQELLLKQNGTGRTAQRWLWVGFVPPDALQAAVLFLDAILAQLLQAEEMPCVPLFLLFVTSCDV